MQLGCRTHRLARRYRETRAENYPGGLETPRVTGKNPELCLFAQMAEVSPVMTVAGHLEQAAGGRHFIIEREKDPEPSVQSCLEGVGISVLSEWDVLAFLHRHRTSLTSADQIARLLGYESAAVGGALDRLERNRLIERSRTSRGVRLYRIRALTDIEGQRSLCHLMLLSESRCGRLLLTRQLQPVRDACSRELQSAGA